MNLKNFHSSVNFFNRFLSHFATFSREIYRPGAIQVRLCYLLKFFGLKKLHYSYRETIKKVHKEKEKSNFLLFISCFDSVTARSHHLACFVINFLQSPRFVSFYIINFDFRMRHRKKSCSFKVAKTKDILLKTFDKVPFERTHTRGHWNAAVIVSFMMEKRASSEKKTRNVPGKLAIRNPPLDLNAFPSFFSQKFCSADGRPLLAITLCKRHII